MVVWGVENQTFNDAAPKEAADDPVAHSGLDAFLRAEQRPSGFGVNLPTL
jgi:hypothetical protein